MMESEIKCMLDNGIVEPSCSIWAFRCLLLNKADKTPRFCTDYCKINSVTKLDLLPHIEDCIDQVAQVVFE